jgi:hypothetical protein
MIGNRTLSVSVLLNGLGYLPVSLAFVNGDIIGTRYPQQSFTSPDPNDPHFILTIRINDPERMVDTPGKRIC